MTALCGGGASGPKPTNAGVSYLTGNALENILQDIFGLSEAWAGVIVFAAAQSVDWSTLCASDPPGIGVLTGTEVLDILASPWDITQPAFQKLQNMILTGLWYYGCQCTGATTPAPPSWPTYPTGAPQVNPTNTPTQGGDCLHIAGAHTFTDPGAHPVDLSPYFFGTTTQVAVTGHPYGLTDAYVIGAGNTTFTINTETLDNPGNPVNSGEIDIEWFDQSGAHLAGRTLQAGPSGTIGPATLPVTANAYSASIYCAFGSVSPSTTMSYAADIQFHCPNAAVPQQPCCPPDTSLNGTLQQILNFVSAIYSSIPAAVNSLSEGTVHSGLTGAGNFVPAATTIACKVAFTVPSSYGEKFGDPITAFDIGWITTSAVEGNYQPRRLQHNPELIIFDKFVDQVHYTLSAGVVATITELSRGP